MSGATFSSTGGHCRISTPAASWCTGGTKPLVFELEVYPASFHPIGLSMSIEGMHYDACGWGGPFRTNHVAPRSKL